MSTEWMNITIRQNSNDDGNDEKSRKKAESRKIDEIMLRNEPATRAWIEDSYKTGIIYFSENSEIVVIFSALVIYHSKR